MLFRLLFSLCLCFRFCSFFVKFCLFQLRVIRAFRSTLEDLNERRSMHSLHSLRSPRTGIPVAVGGGHPLYNFNLLNPNYIKHQQQQEPKLPPQTQLNVSSGMMSPDISYIDEDPQQQQRTLHNGLTSQRSSMPSNVPSSNQSFSKIAQTLQQKIRGNIETKHSNGQIETRI